VASRTWRSVAVATRLLERA